MASASFTVGGQAWPDGTVVSAYPAASLPAGATVPGGQAIDSGIVSGGRVTFLSLAEGVRYVAYAGGVARWFMVPQQDPTDARSLRARVDELGGDRMPLVEGRVGTVETDVSTVATYAATREKVETFLLGALTVAAGATYYPLKIIDREIRVTGMTITNLTTLTVSQTNWWSIRLKNFRDGVEQDMLDNTEWGNVGAYIIGASDVTTITANLSYILPSTFTAFASMRPGDILKARLAGNGTPTALSGFVLTLNYREL